MKKMLSCILSVWLIGTFLLLPGCNRGTTVPEGTGETTTTALQTTASAKTTAPVTTTSFVEPPEWATYPPTTAGTRFDPDVHESYSDDDSDREYYSPFVFKFPLLTSRLGEIVGNDVVENWVIQHEKKKYGDRLESITWREADYYEQTPVLCLQELHISKEQLTELVEQINAEGRPMESFSLEEIDVLYSGDEALINRTFKNEDALYDNGKLYTPYWLASKTAADYQAAGLSLKGLEQQVQLFQKGAESGEGWIYGKRLAAIEKNLAEYRALLGK